ncbi:hypothetical protein [Nostoc sp.]
MTISLTVEVHRLPNRFSLFLAKALLMWAIGVMSGVLGGNLARFQLEKFIDRPKKHFSVTIFNNVDWGSDRWLKKIFVSFNLWNNGKCHFTSTLCAIV